MTHLSHAVRGALVVLAALFALGAAACNESTAFPPGLEALEDNTAEFPEPEGDEMYPPKFNAVFGQTREFYWGHLRGYFHAPAEDVWQAIKDPMVVADRRTADRIQFELNTEPALDYSYTLSYFVDDIIDVEWDEAWRFGIAIGDDSQPDLVVSRSQKIYGTTFINLVETSFRVERIAENVTLFEVVEHLNAVQASTARIDQWFQDLTASIDARTHGQPLPEY